MKQIAHIFMITYAFVQLPDWLRQKASKSIKKKGQQLTPPFLAATTAILFWFANIDAAAVWSDGEVMS